MVHPYGLVVKMMNWYLVGYCERNNKIVVFKWRLQSLVRLFDKECSKGNTAFIRMREEGHQQLYIDGIEFIKENMKDWI